MIDLQQIDQNLLASSKRPKKASPPPKPENTHAQTLKRKKILKITAYALVGILSFFVFLVLQLPEEAIVGNILNLLNQQTPYFWDAKKGAIHLFFTPHLSFEKLSVTPRFGDTSHPTQIDSIDLYPNIIRSLPWTGHLAPSLSFDMNYFGADVSGTVKMGTDMDFRVTAENVKLEKIPQLKAMSLDIKGLLNLLHIDMNLEQSHFAKANGSMQITGKNLIFDPTSLNTGLPIPPLSIGPIVLQAPISGGKVQINKLTIGDATHDVEMNVEGTIALKDPIDFSDLDLRIRFRIADSVMKAAPSLEGMLPIVAAKRADGFYGMKISGNMSNLGMPTPMAQ